MKTSRQKVDEVIDFTSKYIAQVIRSGSLEMVCIPYFGKFEGKLKHAAVMDYIRSIPRAMYNDSYPDMPTAPTNQPTNQPITPEEDDAI